MSRRARTADAAPVIRRSTPLVSIPAADLRDGQWMVDRHGNVREVTPLIRRTLAAVAPSAPIMVYAP